MIFGSAQEFQTNSQFFSLSFSPPCEESPQKFRDFSFAYSIIFDSIKSINMMEIAPRSLVEYEPIPKSLEGNNPQSDPLILRLWSHWLLQLLNHLTDTVDTWGY